jgi:hypothetical protein
MKPRQPGSVFDALVKFFTQIGEAEGSPGQGIEIAANFEGKSKFTLTHEIDPDDQKHRLSLLSAARLAGRFKVPALAEYFSTLAGGTFLPLPRRDIAPRWAELTSAAIMDMGRFSSEIVQDLADGKISRDEAGRIIILLDEVQRHVAALRAMAGAVAAGEDLS